MPQQCASNPPYELTAVAHAEGKQLDLHLDTEPFYEDKSSESPWYRDNNFQTREQALSSRCREMQKQIKALKGKPQQKFALQQQFEAECLL